MKYIAAATINPARFVTRNSADGKVQQSVLNDRPFGISGQSQKDVREDAANTAHADAEDPCVVHDGTGNAEDGTVMLTLGGTVAFGDPLMPDASGQGIVATAGEYFGATALQDGVSGEIIAVRPEMSGLVAANTEAVITQTSDYTVLTGESGSVYSTAGAAGTVTFTLPAATVGLKYKFAVGAAQELRIDPDGTETIALPSTGVQGAAGKYLTANADGETVYIQCVVAGEWAVFGYTGTWTAEA